MTDKVTPFSLRDAPSLIEHVFPVQHLSAESFKEQMAVHGKTLTALGSFWKGRKPLILNRACILGALLPSTGDAKADLEIFELLMGMDSDSMRKRLNLKDDDILPLAPYRELVSAAKRPEELTNNLDMHIWKKVNAHLGTNASNFKELTEQLGVMRFGRTPLVADTFSGSGQIPFSAAQLGCDVYASDLNPIACMLTWGAMNIVGAQNQIRTQFDYEQQELISGLNSFIDDLGVETDGNGWRGKVYLYCLEITCPSSGWIVPLLPTLIVSKGKRVVAQLAPDHVSKRYNIEIISDASERQMADAQVGTYIKDSVVHFVDGIEHKNRLASIRGDYTDVIDGRKVTKNKLRQWDKSDTTFKSSDIFRERLYAIQWVRDDGSSRPDTEFRSITKDDLTREEKVKKYVQAHLAEWQKKGFITDVQIEAGDKTDEPIRTRGWTYWHHLFNPRQLLVFSYISSKLTSAHAPAFASALNVNSRLSRWNYQGGGGGIVAGTFDSQALNPLLNNTARGSFYLRDYLAVNYKRKPILSNYVEVVQQPANKLNKICDIFITDPPYGDAVKYEEIYEFFIAWLKKNPPKEFAHWVWDSRRVLAIKGEDHDFKLAMVSAYKKMAEYMPDNGLQIVMFTHQSGSIWADMANIVWASDLKVSAAWYIVTETDSALREGQHVKGTILLVLRKRIDKLISFRDELAYELKDEVESQVELLTGLNSKAKDLYRDENLFEDADIQMAGYAAALRVLTKYSIVDGVDMANESMRPRIKGQNTLVDDLIEFAVNIANQYLVPQGVSKGVWDDLTGIERFYFKMLDMESKGINTLANYQNFSKAFKVLDFSSLIGESKANKTQLKTSEILGKRYMGSADEFGVTNVRNILYGIFLLMENKLTSDDVLQQLKQLVPDFYRKRDLLIAIADYINKKTSGIREIESQSARILRDLIRNERV